MSEQQVSGPASNPRKYGGWGIRDGLASFGSAVMSMFRGTRVERTSSDQAEVRENASKSSWSSYLNPWTWWRSSGSQKEEREVVMSNPVEAVQASADDSAQVQEKEKMTQQAQALLSIDPCTNQTIQESTSIKAYENYKTEERRKGCLFLGSTVPSLQDCNQYVSGDSTSESTSDSSRSWQSNAQIRVFIHMFLKFSEQNAPDRFFTDVTNIFNQNLLTEEIRNQYQIPKDAIMVTQLTLPKSSSKEFPKTIEATVTVMNSRRTGDLSNKSNHLYVLKYSLTVAKDGIVSAPTCTLAGAPIAEGVAALYDANGNAKPIYS